VRSSFIAGSVTGAAVCLVGFASLSLMAPPIDRTAIAPTAQPEAEAPSDALAAAPVVSDAPVTAETPKTGPDAVPTVPVVEPAPALPEAQSIADAKAEPTPDLAETSTAGQPAVVVAAPDASAAPDPSATLGDLALPGNVPSPEAGLPKQPAEVAQSAPIPAVNAGSVPLEDPVARVSGAGSQGGFYAINPDANMGSDAVPPKTVASADQPAAAPVPEQAAAATPLPATTMADGATQPQPAPESVPEAAPDVAKSTAPEAVANADQPAPADGMAPADTAPAADASAGIVPDATPAPSPEPQIATAESAPDSAAPALSEPAPSEPAPEAKASDITTPQPQPSTTLKVDPELAPAPPLPQVVTLVPEDAPADGQKPKILVTDTGADLNRPAPGLNRTVPGVKVNRLPTISAAPEATAPDAATAPDGAAPGQDVVKPEGALGRYAARFSNPDNKPLLGVMLLDIGVEAGGLDPSALTGLPFATTIAVNPERADVAEVAASYRAVGSEVAIFAGDLPQGATASDLEIAFQSYHSALPEAVAFTGAATADFQRSALMAQHLTQLLSVEGMGFVGYDQGLNPVRRAAERAKLPYASVDKLFGPSEDNSGTLGRELDRAAFAAGQRGSVVVAIPTTPEAITGLMAWAASPAAAGVALAPVSAVMLAAPGGN
jgi:uncharacterized protein